MKSPKCVEKIFNIFISIAHYFGFYGKICHGNGCFDWRGAVCVSGKVGVINNEILTISDLADTLKQPEKKILELLESGLLPGRRVGDEWYVTRRQLLAYIEGDDTPVQKKPTVGGEPNILPFGEWRCNRCDTVNNVDRVECSNCQTARMIPLMGIRLK